MYLSALSIRDLAGVKTLDLAFEDGLNVVVGDNEAGKSTLLTALRAAFFIRHRASGEAVKALAPYGRVARPEVRVRFRTGGVEYELAKAFVQRPEARLEWPGGSLSGDAVEERLAEILRFAHGARGSKLDENQGAFGLLWVEQGNAPGGLDLGVGRHAVTASLEGEVGQILGGERGRRLLAASKALQDRFFTGTLRAKSDSPLKLAEDRLEALRAELVEREAVRRDYEERIERLSDRRQRLASYAADDLRERAEASLAAAEKAAAGIELARRDLQEAERALARAQGAFEEAGERAERRRRLAAEAGSAEAKAAQAADVFATLKGQESAFDAERSACEAALAEARRADEAAERALADAEEHARLVQRRSDLQRDETEAERLRAGIDALVAGARKTLDRKALDRIEAAERARRDAEVRLSVAAPTLIFAPDADRSVRGGDGSLIEPGAPLRVGEETQFAIEGFGRLTIRPGGNAGELAQAAREARAAELRLLADLDCADLAEARRRFAEDGERAQRRQALEAEMRRAAPDGSAELKRQRAEVEAALADLPETTGETTDREAMRLRRREARDARARAEAALEAARAAHRAFERDHVRAEADATHLAGAANALGRELAEAQERRSGAALDEDVAAAQLERQGAQAVLAARSRALETADPDAVRLERDRAAKVLEQTERTLADLSREVSALEGELRVQGASALGEEIERLGGEIAALEPAVERLRLEADAARLLHTTLVESQRSARDHWLGPIRSRVEPYLRIVQPGAGIELDDSTLEIRALKREGQEEEFRRLSHGAREQIAVVTRIALAEVLKQGGHPAAVILDDALVNTDEKRLARMHLVLRRAAEHMQVVVLTCRERDFRDLGAPILRV